MPPLNLLHHIFPLIMATGQALGGLMPFFSPSRAILTFGLPPRIASSAAARATFTLYSSRATVIGVAMWVFYLRGEYRAVDTVMALLAYGGVVDAWVCAREGMGGKAWFRGVLGVACGLWGGLGMTAAV